MKFLGKAPDRMALRLQQLQTQYQSSACVHAMARLGIADAIRDTPRTLAEIARAIDGSAYGVERLVRTLVALELLAAVDGERFALTPMSQWLRTDIPHSLSPGMWTGNQIYRFLADLDLAVKHGGPIGKNLYETIDAEPGGPAQFRNAIAVRASWEYGSLTDAFDFTRFRTMVDVGGGSGLLTRTVLAHVPQLRSVLFDLPAVVELSRPQIAAWGLADRVDCVGGSYFETIPEGGDLYVIAEVLYDWTDQRALDILRRCLAAMTPGATVLVIEIMLPEDQPDTSLLLYNLALLAMNGGGLRRPSDYRRLLTRAGFRVIRHQTTGGMNSSLMEAVRD